MSSLEKLRTWIAGFFGTERLWIDQFSPCPGNGSIAPLGMTQLSRQEDILGTVTVSNRWDLKIYFVLPKAREEDGAATDNARQIMEFQQWVQSQSIRGAAPVLGDVPEEERFVAQQGKLEEVKGEGTAVYSVKLSAFFTKIFPPEVR